MWNLHSCNKIIQQRAQQKSYEIHRQKLKSMQSRVKIQQPMQPDFIYTKNKLNMARKDRRIEIDRLNHILLNKMEGIRLAEYNGNKLRPQAQNLKTINAHTMELMNQEIAKENKRFCAKLLRTQSYYPTYNILQKADHLDYVASNISYNARRCMSARSLKTRPKSSYTSAFSSAQKKKSGQYSRPVSGVAKIKVETTRPETAPMFSRSAQKRILVTESGRPRIQAQQTEEYL